ncbi:MAG: hypothetical protein GYA17_20710 [Chloroflexi bacterium]|jgi:hypothetical protein|nr:hypothetical protein [Anaerolineaceae bacterium]NMB90789.1 hypothetical protein [Chloroflexota bacterium]
MAELIFDVTNMPREQAVAEAMRVLGFSRPDAEFYVSIERREIHGDVILVDEADGKTEEKATG